MRPFSLRPVVVGLLVAAGLFSVTARATERIVRLQIFAPPTANAILVHEIRNKGRLEPGNRAQRLAEWTFEVYTKDEVDLIKSEMTQTMTALRAAASKTQEELTKERLLREEERDALLRTVAALEKRVKSLESGR